MIEHFGLGDTVKMKKPHPCGSSEWVITRTGADIKIKCLGCGRVVMLDRELFLKRAAKITARADDQKEDAHGELR
ncbi:MAG: DUF951 domain-containing protein [Christensenellales bacterium]|jgi:hypothetical protein